MKLFQILFFLYLTPTYAQNIIEIKAKLVPESGSFIAKSNRAKGRLLKKGDSFSADRISVFASSFDTESPLRNKHFADYLSGGPTRPFPRIDLLNLTAANGAGKGTMKINNTLKEVVINYTTNKSLIYASFQLTPSDFNLSKIDYLGVGVKDDVEIKVTYKFESI